MDLSDTPGGDGRSDQVHRVVDRETRGHRAAWIQIFIVKHTGWTTTTQNRTRAIDVHVNGLLAGLALQKQQLGDHRRGNVVVDLNKRYIFRKIILNLCNNIYIYRRRRC